jgi:hypothetical protein
MKTEKEECMPKCVPNIDLVGDPLGAPMDREQLAPLTEHMATVMPESSRQAALLGYAWRILTAFTLMADCRITGEVISTQWETKAVPANRQMRVEIKSAAGCGWPLERGKNVLVVTRPPHATVIGERVESGVTMAGADAHEITLDMALGPEGATI